MNVYVSTSLEAGRWRREVGPRRLLRSLLQAVLPLRNPDFETRYDDVVRWLLEIDQESGRVRREIGLDELATPIVIAPYRENVGFWAGNDEPVEWQGMPRIKATDFEGDWERFTTGHGETSP